VQNSLCVQALSSTVLAPLLHGTPAGSGRQPNFAAWYKEAGENVAPFFSTPVFDVAAIMWYFRAAFSS